MLDGATVREHLESVQRQTGVLHEALQGETPEGLLYLWEWFGRMNMRRPSMDGMPGPITNTEMKAWAELHGVRLSPFEVEVLDGLDSLFLAHCRKRMMKK